MVIAIPGCDVTKEFYPDPAVVHAHQRGMHLLVMDGPGQGASNLRNVKLTHDNYQRALMAVVDYLQTRDEIDGDAITVYTAPSRGATPARSTSPPAAVGPVSYTHLTLPTIYSV